MSQPRTVIWITTRVVLYHTNICTYVRRDKSHILILRNMLLQPFQSHGSCSLRFSGLADHAISCFRILRITQLAASAFCISHNITDHAISCFRISHNITDHAILCFRISHNITDHAILCFRISHNITGRVARGAVSSMKVGTVTAPTSTNTHNALFVTSASSFS